MKKEEEIEKLSQSILKTIDSVASLTVTKEEENIFHQGFYSGYRQCEKQQYTKEDMRKAFYYGGKSAIDEWGTFEEFINSLNKGD